MNEILKDEYLCKLIEEIMDKGYSLADVSNAWKTILVKRLMEE